MIFGLQSSKKSLVVILTKCLLLSLYENIRCLFLQRFLFIMQFATWEIIRSGSLIIPMASIPLTEAVQSSKKAGLWLKTAILIDDCDISIGFLNITCLHR